MQSNKASKKTKIADNVSGTSETSAAAEQTVTPRNSRSSKLKKETNEMGPAKHRKSSSSETQVEVSPAAQTKPAGASTSSTEAPIIDSVGAVTAVENPTKVATRSTEISPTHEEIAKLAHSYWAARGYTHGSPEEDWVRAEHELKTKR